jgi:hypothetical protein
MGVGRANVNFFIPVDPETFEPYVMGEGIASSVTISGDALTAMEASATSLAAIATAIGVAGDAAGDPTVIGLLKQIAENTTPA